MAITAEKVADALKLVKGHLERTNVIKGDTELLKAKGIILDLI